MSVCANQCPVAKLDEIPGSHSRQITDIYNRFTDSPQYSVTVLKSIRAPSFRKNMDRIMSGILK